MPMAGVPMLSLFFVIPAPAQNQATPRSPKEVLLAYRAMDAAGQRLTAGGWYRACRFFVKPSPPPRHYVMAVMDGEVFNDFRVNGDRADVSLRCSAVGQIDPSGRFTSLVAPSLMDSSGHLVTQPKASPMHGPVPVMRSYGLVRTDTHWEFGPAREGPREVKGPPEWRLEYFEFEPWVTIEVAIRYLTGLRDESGSEVIKKNADKSIAALRGLLRTQTR